MPEGQVSLQSEIVELRHLLDEARARLARQAIEHQVSRLVMNAATVEQALTGVVCAICEGLQVDFCAVWLPSEDGSNIRCHAHACAGDLRELAPFTDATLAARFPPGVGLPGRVWQSGQPHWLEVLDADHNFPRAGAAAAARGKL